MPMHPGNPEAEGFTLIELLVVVAIISLLLTILVPSLNEAKELARAVQCKSDLHNVGLGIIFYDEDYSHTLPPGGLNNIHSGEMALRKLVPYVNEKDYVIGRTRHNTWRVLRGETPPMSQWPGDFHCPSYMNDVRASDDWRHVSWSWNYLDGGPLRMFQENPHRSYPADYPWAGIDRFPAASTALFLGGSAWYRDLPVNALQNVSETGVHARFCHPNETVNMSYLDGHVEAQGRYWAISRTSDELSELLGR